MPYVEGLMVHMLCLGTRILQIKCTVENAHYDSLESQDGPRYDWSSVVTEYAILMAKAHSELTNGNLDIVFNEGQVKSILKSLFSFLKTQVKEPKWMHLQAFTTPWHAPIWSTLCLTFQHVSPLHWLCSCYLNFCAFAIHSGEPKLSVMLRITFAILHHSNFHWHFMHH